MSTMGGGKLGYGFASPAGTQLSSVMIDQTGNGGASYKAHRIMVAAVVGGGGRSPRHTIDTNGASR